MAIKLKLPRWFMSRSKSAPVPAEMFNPRQWISLVREGKTGDWQRGITLSNTSVLANHAVFACTTLIASDIAKLQVMLQKREGKIWVEFESSAYSPVLRKPNKNQTRIRFWEAWILSKLTRGNTYVLKVRDNRNVVVELYVLDPSLVRPLVADNGDVFYSISPDNFSGVTESITIPASEIIHDRWNCLFHPLVGMSPMWANALSAAQGLSIQENSTAFFGNNSQPGGILTAPGNIAEPDAVRLKEAWTQNFSGKNVGKVAVLGSGLKYEAMAVKPVDAQLIEQLKWTADVICSTFHIPPYKIGLGEAPTYNNVQALNTEYYAQALQILIEDAELCLSEGLGVGTGYRVTIDERGLLRMDTVSQVASLKEAVGAGIMAPNEARADMDLPPVEGGESPLMQEQNYSLAALAKRDAREDPFAKGAAAAPTPAEPPNDDLPDDDSKSIFEMVLRNKLMKAAA